MIAKYNNKSIALAIPGFCLQIGCLIAMVFLTPTPGWVASLLLLGMLTGHILIIVGFCYYAVAKGHSALLGAFGMLSLLGFLVLALLPDRSRDEIS